jgi:hypothetical protein
MNKLRKIYLALVTCLLLNVISVSAQDRLNSTDLLPLVGEWEGSLTYLDYTSGKPYSMKANQRVEQPGGKNLFLFFSIYPNEPAANGVDSVIIADDGLSLNEERVVSVHKHAGNETEIITEFESVDGNDNKPAIIRHFYKFSMSSFSLKKEVKFKDSDLWLLRHEYKFVKKK